MYKLSSASTFNLDQSKNFLFGKELQQANDKMLVWSKLKAFADNKIHCISMYTGYSDCPIEGNFTWCSTRSVLLQCFC